MNTNFIDPSCPDFQNLTAAEQESTLNALAEAVQSDAAARGQVWSKGFTRRKLFGGAVGASVAALGAQLVTTRVAYAAPGEGNNGNVVVTLFLRGGMDGLSVLVPAEDPELLKARPDIAVRAKSLIQFNGARNFGLHPALAALQPMLKQGKIAAVPDIATPQLTRSHFAAQDTLERGGGKHDSQSGWLDRVVGAMPKGTTFRSMSVTGTLSRSLAGTSPTLVGNNPGAFNIYRGDEDGKMQKALEALYTGLDHPFAVQTGLAIEANAQSTLLEATAKSATSTAPKGNFGNDLNMLSTLIRSGVGLRVANMDLGGWDMHTNIGSPEKGDMHDMLTKLAEGIAWFFTSLGDKADKVTMVVMSEFGRRVEQNASSGADHGHGGLALAIGGGVKGGVHGTWKGMAPSMLDSGDLPGNNDYRDFLGEVVMSRLGLSAGQMATVFPEWKISPKGVMVPA